MGWISFEEKKRIMDMLSENKEQWRTMKFKQNEMGITLTAQKNRIKRLVEKVQRLRQELRSSNRLRQALINLDGKAARNPEGI